MSGANVETLRRGYDALNSGDLSVVLALLDPDIECGLLPPVAQAARRAMGRTQLLCSAVVCRFLNASKRSLLLSRVSESRAACHRLDCGLRWSRT